MSRRRTTLGPATRACLAGFRYTQPTPSDPKSDVCRRSSGMDRHWLLRPATPLEQELYGPENLKIVGRLQPHRMRIDEGDPWIKRFLVSQRMVFVLQLELEPIG